MRLGKIIKGWRDSQKLGIRAVAQDIGISHGTLSRIERDEEVDGKTLIKLLTWLFT
jgi:transcriptional regulator with XRE-family HTH domain